MPRAASHAAQAAAAPPAPRPRRSRPARRSSDSHATRSTARGRSSTARPGSRPAGAAGARGAVVRFPTPATRLLDRVHPGRVWVALVGALLVGIVFFNVSLLELNGGIAKTSERVTELKRQNSDLRLDVARLGSAERIERRAAALGFYLPEPNEVTYLSAEPAADAPTAATALDGGAAELSADGSAATYPPG